MQESGFWSLIEQTRLRAEGNCEQQIELLGQELLKMRKNEVTDFDRILQMLLAKANNWDLWGAAYVIKAGCSNDGFAYFRCGLITHGREVFEAALRDPETLLETASPDVDAEGLLYVAAEAYEEIAGEKLSVHGVDKDEPTGEPWEENPDVLEKMFPRLFNRFYRRRWLEKLVGKAKLMAAPGLFHKPAEAARLFKEAAELGHGGAMHELGVLNSIGVGVEQNNLKAHEFFQSAAKAGEPAGWYCLGVQYQQGTGCSQDLAQAARCYQHAVDLGNVDALSNLGVLYLNGQGVELNHQKAFELFRRASEAGSPAALNNLGVLYQHGQGTEVDYTQAMECFHSAAEAGNAQGYLNMGYLHEKGLGVKPNVRQAKRYFRLALDSGIEAAAKELKRLQ